MTIPESERVLGTIIVDASALMALEATVSPSHRDGSRRGIKRYVDILPFLAEQGYRIVIPEMVALETASILPAMAKPSRESDKRLLYDVDEYFPRKDDAKRLARLREVKSFIKDAIDGLRWTPFFGQKKAIP